MTKSKPEPKPEPSRATESATWRCSNCNKPVPAECDGACGSGITNRRAVIQNG